MKKPLTKSDLKERIEMSLSPTWRIGIVYSAFYKEEIDVMLKGAISTLVDLSVPKDHIAIHSAPGAFEIPLIGSRLAKAQSIDALIGLGIIVEGQTHHARLIAEQSARGMMDVQLQYGIPFVNEVLYTDTRELAGQRLHKGEEAAVTVLRTLVELEHVRRS